MDQISIDIKTIDWTEVDHSCLGLMITKGKSATIAWGDGRKQTARGRQDCLNGGLVWTSICHYYAHKDYGYTIDIQGDDGAIIGFSGMAMFEQVGGAEPERQQKPRVTKAEQERQAKETERFLLPQIATHSAEQQLATELG